MIFYLPGHRAGFVVHTNWNNHYLALMSYKPTKDQQVCQGHELFYNDVELYELVIIQLIRTPKNSSIILRMASYAHDWSSILNL